MPKHKYFAEIDGQTFSRNSDRVYTHMVVGRVRLKSMIEYMLDCIKGNNERANEYRAVIESGVVPAQWARSSSIEDYKRYLENQLRRIQQQTQEVVELQTRVDAGEVYDAWRVIGWCGRYDLAMKQCKQDDNRILEVQTR